MIYLLIIVFLVLISAYVTKAMMIFFNHKDIMARTIDSQKLSIPVGGGWAIVFISLPLMTAFHVIPMVILLGSLLCIWVSWADDIKHVNPFFRLAIYSVAILVPILLLPSNVLLFQGYLPLWLDRFVIFLSWLWFVNLYNFMDGIDGISGSETISICLGILLIALITTIPSSMVMQSCIIMGATAGFLIYNWQPAKIYLGDLGSIFLGYIMGYILLSLALSGYFFIALMLPLFYLMDSTITICRRILKLQKIWKPHREQYIHRSVDKAGRSHSETDILIIICNLLLIALAILSILTGYAYVYFILGVLITYLFMKKLTRR